MKLSDILSNTEFIANTDIESVSIESVSIDAESIENSALFISLRADTEAEARAIKNGCVAIMRPRGEADYSVPVIYTDNIRRDYAHICYKLSGADIKKIKLIGVTGTNGKTSTATVIYKILNSLGHKCGFIGTGKIEIPGKLLNSNYYSSTTPDPHILYPAIREMQESGCEYAVMEVSSHSLYYEKTVPLKFAVSIFTNLSHEHMDFHKNMQEYYTAKKKICDSSDIVIINADDEYGRKLSKDACCRSRTVGAVWDGDIMLKNISANNDTGIEYMYCGTGFSFIARSRLVGVFNIYNTALAITALIELGFAPCEVKRALLSVEKIDGRFEKISDNPTVIIDYAHTPMGFENLLKTITSLGSGKRISVVFGCGGERDREKRPIMARIAEKYCEKITVTSDNPRGESRDSIISEITAGFSIFADYRIIPDREAAIFAAIKEAKKDDIVAIVGKGAENYYIDKEGYHPYSDREVALSALAKAEKEVDTSENQA